MTTRHEAQQTTDHQKIRKWAEARGGRPASVRGTEEGKEEAGVLRIAFTDDEDLEEIGWDEFFDKFEEEHLAFLYQDRTAEGGESRFFKLVERGEPKHGRGREGSHGGTHGSRTRH
ncbi:MAG TPA: hypothetical protein VFH52_10470 [Rhodanobacteraceae bacterium]|nr:hypothetical protein [Rhodanobacteraceae bacterium]